MRETLEKTKKICEMRKYLEDYIYPKVTCGENMMTVQEGGDFIDMIKDLCEAEKDCWKACYYKKMAEGMEPYRYPMMQDQESNRRGYDNWRYSSGQFAPTGHGHRNGYMPSEEIYDGMSEYFPGFMDKMMRQGYTPSTNPNSNVYDRSNPNNRTYGYDGMGREDGRYGRAYDQWKTARRGYTESHSHSDKKDMDTHAKEHMADMIMTCGEIWEDADPEMKKKMVTDFFAMFKTMCKNSDQETKKKMKTELTSLMNEMV